LLKKIGRGRRFVLPVSVSNCHTRISQNAAAAPFTGGQPIDLRAYKAGHRFQFERLRLKAAKLHAQNLDQTVFRNAILAALRIQSRYFFERYAKGLSYPDDLSSLNIFAGENW
jgi:hypothetical protein